MLITLSHNNPQLIAFEVKNHLHINNINEVLDYIFQGLTIREAPASILCKMDHAAIDVASFFHPKLIEMVRKEPWENIKKIKRVAIIGDTDFLRKLTQVDGFFAKLWNPEIDERYFASEQLHEAWEFVNEME